MSTGFPDFYTKSYIKIFEQIIPLILRPEWQAGLDLDFSVKIGSPAIAAGDTWTGDYTVPSGETWMVHYFFISPQTNLATGQPAYTEVYDGSTGVRFFEGPLLADRPLIVVFPKPWKCPGGDILRVVVTNKGSASAYWVFYWAGYKI